MKTLSRNIMQRLLHRLPRRLWFWLSTVVLAVSVGNIVLRVSRSSVDFWSSNINTIIVPSPPTLPSPTLYNATSTAAGPNSTFSACLMFKDDNPRLPEWLAYHYYAFQMDLVVMVVDPMSVTSPDSILARWSSRIEFVQITTADFVRDASQRAFVLNRTNYNARQIEEAFKIIQVNFYKHCTRYLKTRQRGLTLYIDTDEYVGFSEEYRARYSAVFSNAPQLAKLLVPLRDQPSVPAHLARVIYLLRDNVSLFHSNSSAAVAVPLANINYVSNAPGCFALPRVLMSAVESPAKLRRIGNVSMFLSPDMLATTRYRHRATPWRTRSGPPKCIMDVQYFREHYRQQSAHKPLHEQCPMHAFYTHHDLLLGIYHYVGGWETNVQRRDGRKDKSFARWWQSANGTMGVDATTGRALTSPHGTAFLLPLWIAGFVDQVGMVEAKRLLLHNMALDDRADAPPLDQVWIKI